MPHVSEQHAQHDPLLVVSLAAGDLTGADRDLATSLITGCAECATLHDDLLAIAQATAALPTAVRPRDFQLSPEQAARLRPLGWRRFVAAFASPRLAMTRQLGIGLTTLGLAGLLVSVLPTAGLPSMGSAAGASAAPPEAASTTGDTRLPGVELAPSAAASGAAASAAASASASSAALQPAADTAQPSASGSYGAMSLPSSTSQPDRTSASSGDGTVGGVTAQGSGSGKSTTAPAPGQRESLDQSAAEDSGPSLVLVASAILLAAGIALLVARRIARGMTGR
jgi:hypothetical protein